MNINDIARLAGVSASTVSKVMNGKDNDISEATRTKVLKIIEEEQYVPYFKYMDKEGLKPHVIGLIIRKNHRERENIVLHVEQAARARGYGVLVSYVDDIDDIQTCVNELIKKRVSGLMIDSVQKIHCGKLDKAAVYFTQTKKFETNQGCTFYYSLTEAGRLAADRLIEEGHKKIACITKTADEAVIEGYKQALQNQNIRVQPLCMYSGETLEDIEKYGLNQCISQNVTAIICGSPEVTCCVWKMLERMKMVIPDEFSVISVGDGELLNILGDGITGVEFPVKDMSYRMVKLLCRMIDQDEKMRVTEKFPPRTIERNSIVSPAREKQGDMIIVVGSMNMDITTEVTKLPIGGETQIAERLFVFPGGKGGNQAVGAGKLGGQVHMIGCLGQDMDGKQLYTSLFENHVHMDGVLFDKTSVSGKAYINVDEAGESTIVVYQGANKNLNIEQIKRCRYLFQKAKYCLISLEIPEEVVEYTIKTCERNQVQVILKPSGVKKIKKELLSGITYFVPNEKELGLLVPEEGTMEEKVKRLRNSGVKNVIVTMGERGCYLENDEMSRYFSGSGFEAIDTTGGADSFISALAVLLSEGKSLVYAIGFAIYASGITVTRYGVQPALPERKSVDIFEDEIIEKYKIVEEEK